MKKVFLLIMLLGLMSNTVLAKSGLRPYYVNDAQDLTFWLRSEFVYRPDKGGDYWQSPMQTVQRHKGDCEDFAFLVQHVFHDLLTKAYVIAIDYPNRKVGHAICVFKDKKGWSYFSNQYYKKVNAKTVDDLIKKAYPNTTYDYIYAFNAPIEVD